MTREVHTEREYREGNIIIMPGFSGNRVCRFVVLCGTWASALFLGGMTPGKPDSLAVQNSLLCVPVTIEGDTLFSVCTDLGPFTPAQRAAEIEERLRSIVGKERMDSVAVVESAVGSDIVAGGVTIMSVTDGDADAVGSYWRELAGQCASVPFHSRRCVCGPACDQVHQGHI